MVLDLLVLVGLQAGVRAFRERRDRERVVYPTASISSSSAASSSLASLDSSINSSTNSSPATLAEIYEQKSISGREMRILVLNPGSFSDPLDCELEEGHLDYSDYEALSYTWGPPPDTHPLTVDDVEIEIRENLYWALKYLRSTTSTRRLWVDAICIDQDDENDEKTEQMPLMGDVYENATRTIAWLGRTDDKSSRALAHFRKINDGNLTDQRMLQDYHRNKETWLDFGDALLTRDWFTRAWTVQEYIRAQKLVFQCGEDVAPQELFAMISLLGMSPGIQLKRSRDRERTNNIGLTSEMASLVVCKEKWDNKEMRNLIQWIPQFLHRDCGDPKDHIFAYMGLHKVKPEFPRLHRDRPWQDIYLDSTEHIIKEYGALDFIFIAQGNDRDKHLPTWVPDLRLRRHTVEPALPRLNIHRPVYKASKGRKPRVTFEGTFMNAWGLVYSKISRITDPHGDDNATIEAATIAQSRKWATETDFGIPRAQWKYYCQHNHTYEEAFARTMVMDIGMTNERCRPGEGFEEWKNHSSPPSFFRPELPRSTREAAWKEKKLHQEMKWRQRRRFAIFECGRFGMVPANACVGDTVVILDGASMPCVIRKQYSRWYNIIGAWSVIKFTLSLSKHMD
jgi:hypothetical protein